MADVTSTGDEMERKEAPAARASRSDLGRWTMVMASGTLVSRILGFVRTMLLVAALGVNAAGANAYDVANRIPNAMFALLAAGVLNSALVPQIVKAFGNADGKRIVDRIVTIGSVISAGAAAVLTIAAPIMVRVYSQDWSPELLALATGLAYWIIPQLFFYGLYTLLGQVLNAREQFGPFMWAPVLNNVIGIAGLVAYIAIYGKYVTGSEFVPSDWTPERIALLGGVATLGIAAQALILVIPLVRGGYRWKWRWSGPRGELTTLRRIVSWALAAVAVEQVGVALTTQVASAANPDGEAIGIAGNAAYTSALTVYLVPHSLVTVSILTALFTTMSRFYSQGDLAGLRSEISRGARLIGVFTVYATAMMLVIGPLVVRALLPTASNPEARSVTEVVWVLSLGLVPLGLSVLVKRVLFVMEDARSVFLIHIPMTLAWLAVAYGVQAFADPRWWAAGVAAGLVASNVVAVLVRGVTLHRRLGGIDARRTAVLHVKALIGAIPAVAAGAGLMVLGPDPEWFTELGGALTSVSSLGYGGLVAAAMALVYGTVLRLLRVEELEQVLRPLMRRLRRVR